MGRWTSEYPKRSGRFWVWSPKNRCGVRVAHAMYVGKIVMVWIESIASLPEYKATEEGYQFYYPAIKQPKPPRRKK